MVMVRKYKKAWLKELRSGNHKQLQGRLTDINHKGKRAYCCLGVLCRVLDKKFNVCKLDMKEQVVSYNRSYDETELSDSLRKSIGMTYSKMVKLMNMNDEEEATFKEIADYIDEHL